MVKAQVIPDGTIPTSVQQVGNMQEITGGERVGDNLFHSFKEFSVLTGSEAVFKNAIDIKNIFTSVTGGGVSSIDGLLQTQGGANLFLINPNGLVFGKNARLDIGRGGNIFIDVDLIELDGTTKSNGFFTFIGSTSFGGTGGNVKINTSSLRLINGAAISSDSSFNSNSGEIIITASDSIEIIGKEPSQEIPSFVTSSVTVEKNEGFRRALGLPLNPSGNAGSVSITSPNLNIYQGGMVGIRNEGIGGAATLKVDADNLNLDTTGSITAAAESGKGGNIELNIKTLQIGDGSQITERDRAS